MKANRKCQLNRKKPILSQNVKKESRLFCNKKLLLCINSRLLCIGKSSSLYLYNLRPLYNIVNSAVLIPQLNGPNCKWQIA